MNDNNFHKLTEQLKVIYLEPQKQIDPAIRLCDKIIQKFRKHYSLVKLDSYLDLELTVARNRKKYQSYLENHLLGYLHTLFLSKLWNREFPTPLPILNEDLVLKETNPQRKIAHQSALKLLDLVKDLIEVQVPRDSYKSKRQAHALMILDEIWRYYIAPEGIAYCITALKSKKKEPVEAAASTLGHYCHFHKITPPPEVVDIANRQIEKTKNVSIARACADFLVMTEIINKYRAEERVRDWKVRNDYPIF